MNTIRVLHILSGDLFAGKEAQVLALLRNAKAFPNTTQEIVVFNRGRVFDECRAAGVTTHLADESLGLRGWLSSLPEPAGDILVAHGYKESIAAAYLGFRSKSPWISVFHGKQERHRRLALRIKAKLYWLVQRQLALRAASAVVTVSEALVRDLHFSSARVRIIRNVCEQNISTAMTLSHPAIVMVGRLVPVKRIDRAIRGFAGLVALPPFEQSTLYIVGDGPELSSLTTLAAELGCEKRVQFVGYQANARAYVAAADILLLTSDSEGIPTVLLEAMFDGTAIVATAVGGIPEVCSAVPGYQLRLIDPSENASLVTDALRSLLELGPVRSENLALHATVSQSYSPIRATTQYEALYRELYAVDTGHNRSEP